MWGKFQKVFHFTLDPCPAALRGENFKKFSISRWSHALLRCVGKISKKEEEEEEEEEEERKKKKKGEEEEEGGGGGGG